MFIHYKGLHEQAQEDKALLVLKYVTKYYAMEAYVGVEIWLHHS
jgi:hypothetical protein